MESQVLRFVLGRPLPVDETRHYEFKEIKGARPLETIKNTCDEYVVAFLNSAGGRIFWGVRDSDRSVVGVTLSSRERDELRRIVTDKLNQIKPPLSPTAYAINLFPVFEEDSGDEVIEDRWVVEVVAPRPYGNDLYATGSNEVFVKTDSGKRKLSIQEVQDEIRRRMLWGFEGANLPAESVHQPSKRLPVYLEVAEDGWVVGDQEELIALMAEILWATENGVEVDLELHSRRLDTIRTAIRATEQELSPKARLARVSLLRLEARCTQACALIPECARLLLRPPLRYQFAAHDLLDAVNGLVHLMLSEEPIPREPVGERLDLYRRQFPELRCVIWVDDIEASEIVESNGLTSISQFIGPGWDLFDLPRRVRNRRAFPAMVREVVRVDQKIETPLDKDLVLDPSTWYAGLR